MWVAGWGGCGGRRGGGLSLRDDTCMRECSSLSLMVEPAEAERRGHEGVDQCRRAMLATGCSISFCHSCWWLRCPHLTVHRAAENRVQNAAS